MQIYSGHCVFGNIMQKYIFLLPQVNVLVRTPAHLAKLTASVDLMKEYWHSVTYSRGPEKEFFYLNNATAAQRSVTQKGLNIANNSLFLGGLPGAIAPQMKLIQVKNFPKSIYVLLPFLLKCISRSY